MSLACSFEKKDLFMALLVYQVSYKRGDIFCTLQAFLLQCVPLRSKFTQVYERGNRQTNAK